MRDAAMRVEAGISLRRAAKQIGVSDNTLRVYEIDPAAVKSSTKRDAIADYYRRLRTFLGMHAADE